MRPFPQRVARAILGATIGFVGVTVTVETVERFGAGEPSPGERVGAPDFAAYCAQQDDLAPVNLSGDALGWRCAGFIEGLWVTRPILVDEACKQQFGDDTMQNLRDGLDPEGWQCIKNP